MTKNWTYDEGKALINAYANRKEEYFKTRNKKHFWENILTDLEALNVLVSPTTAENVHVKWRSLHRAYKNAKDRGTGTTVSKFLYMDQMDDIFQDNPIISSPHSVSVGMESQPKAAPMVQEKSSALETDESSSSSGSTKSSKRRTKDSGKATLIEIKRKYYEQKIKERKKKTEMLEKYLEKKEQDREDRKQLILRLINK